MTALNFILQEDSVYIATDSLVIDAQTKSPRMFQTKIYPLLHMDGVICGAGVMEFITQWYVHVQSQIVANNILELNKYSPTALRTLSMQMNVPKEFSTTIFQFGFDKDEQRFRGFVYQSINNFEEIEVPYGPVIRPPVPYNFTDDPIENFIKIISDQRELDLSEPQDARIGIGGEVHFFIMMSGEMRFIRCHRFEDYENLYERMIKGQLATPSSTSSAD